MKSTRRRSREFALQGIYQWLLAGGQGPEICAQLRLDKHFDQADDAYFERLLAGAIDAAAELDALIVPYLDRPIVELTPIERAIIMIATLELRDFVEVPYRVIVNEAIELAKDFGGTDGHRFVNGVLDKLGGQLRAAEAGARAGRAG